MSTHSYGEELSRKYTISSTVLLSLYDKRTQPHNYSVSPKERVSRKTQVLSQKVEYDTVKLGRPAEHRERLPRSPFLSASLSLSLFLWLSLSLYVCLTFWISACV